MHAALLRTYIGFGKHYHTASRATNGGGADLYDDQEYRVLNIGLLKITSKLLFVCSAHTTIHLMSELRVFVESFSLNVDEPPTDPPLTPPSPQLDLLLSIRELSK